MSIEVSSNITVQRNGNTQVISVDYEIDKKALKQQDSDRFVSFFSLHNAADDSLIKHLGSDELNLAQVNTPKQNFTVSVQDDTMDVNKGVSRIGRDIVSESVYVRIRIFKIDTDPLATSKSNTVTGAFGPAGIISFGPVMMKPAIN